MGTYGYAAPEYVATGIPTSNKIVVLDVTLFLNMAFERDMLRKNVKMIIC